MDAEKKLRGLIKEMISDERNDKSKEAKENQDEALKKAMEQNAELKAKIEAFEKRAYREVELPVPGEEKKTTKALYKGFNIKNQCQQFKLGDDKKEMVAKAIIDMINKGMSTSDDHRGGYTVPVEFENEILAWAYQSSVALRDCDVRRTNVQSITDTLDGDDVSVVKLATETTEITETTPSIKQLSWTIADYAGYTKITNNLLDDSETDIVSYLAGKYSKAFAKKIDTEVFSGSGFTGNIASASASTVLRSSTTSAASIDWITLSKAIKSVPSWMQNGAKFYWNRLITHYVRTLRDDNNSPIFQQLSLATPGTVLGVPYEEVENGLTNAVAANTLFGVFANLKQTYRIYIRKGMQGIELDAFGLWLTRQTRARAIMRMDGSPTKSDGIVLLKTATL